MSRRRRPFGFVVVILNVCINIRALFEKLNWNCDAIAKVNRERQVRIRLDEVNLFVAFKAKADVLSMLSTLKLFPLCVTRTYKMTVLDGKFCFSGGHNMSAGDRYWVKLAVLPPST